MRISDWSSDVCSSDLAIAVAGRRKSAISHAMNKRAMKPPIAPAASATNEKGGHRKEPALVIPASSMLSFPRKRESRRRRRFSGVGGFTRAVLDSRLRGNDSDGCKADRKRVVEGTRVSVRVDMGGLRLIKKHKQYSITRCRT